MHLAIPSLLLAAVAASGTFASSCPEAERIGTVDIYPTARQLPENLLRFYVYFPRRMGAGDILEHIALLDGAGNPVEGAFLSNRYDLWSPDRRRLTLLLDPGRVKTGLAAHAAMGRALVPDRRYRLVVGAGAEDAQGCALGRDAMHAFVAGPADLDPPAPANWLLEVPRAGSMEPLVVDLGSPHDHLSLAYRLRIRDAHGAAVPGTIELDEAEAVWRFAPKRQWQATPHHIAVNERLEDLAGNRPGTLFDQPLDATGRDWVAEIPFHPTDAQ